MNVVRPRLSLLIASLLIVASLAHDECLTSSNGVPVNDLPAESPQSAYNSEKLTLPVASPGFPIPQSPEETVSLPSTSSALSTYDKGSPVLVPSTVVAQVPAPAIPVMASVPPVTVPCHSEQPISAPVLPVANLRMPASAPGFSTRASPPLSRTVSGQPFQYIPTGGSQLKSSNTFGIQGVPSGQLVTRRRRMKSVPVNVAIYMKVPDNAPMGKVPGNAPLSDASLNYEPAYRQVTPAISTADYNFLTSKQSNDRPILASNDRQPWASVNVINANQPGINPVAINSGSGTENFNGNKFNSFNPSVKDSANNAASNINNMMSNSNIVKSNSMNSNNNMNKAVSSATNNDSISKRVETVNSDNREIKNESNVNVNNDVKSSANTKSDVQSINNGNNLPVNGDVKKFASVNSNNQDIKNENNVNIRNDVKSVSNTNNQDIMRQDNSVVSNDVKHSVSDNSSVSKGVFANSNTNVDSDLIHQARDDIINSGGPNNVLLSNNVQNSHSATLRVESGTGNLNSDSKLQQDGFANIVDQRLQPNNMIHSTARQIIDKKDDQPNSLAAGDSSFRQEHSIVPDKMVPSSGQPQLKTDSQIFVSKTSSSINHS